jgi:hypothetical protein
MASSLADQELLAEAARGDQAAFSQLYQRYRNRVYGFAYRMLGSQEAAEDVRLFLRLDEIRSDLHFPAGDSATENP